MSGAVLMLIVLVALVVAGYRKRTIGLTVWLTILIGLFAFTGDGTFVIVGTILLCLLTGQPLFVLMGLLSLVALTLVTGVGNIPFLIRELEVIIEKILELASKEVLLAIPFFVVAGEVMTQGTLAQRLIDVAKALFGWLPGGLAVAGVAGCIFFAAISGSSPVTVIAIGSIMVPALLRAGYPGQFALGLYTVAGSLGILIPPSIPMIVYSIMVGSTTPVDPIDLFLAGVVPGLLIGGLLAVYAVYTGVRFNLPTDKLDIAHMLREIRRGFWSLLLPVIILGGIYSGVFTATEAAAVSVVYALVVEIFIHGELKPGDLIGVAEKSMTVMGTLFLIIALAIGLNHVLVLEQVPDRMVEWIRTLELSRTTFLIVVNIFLLGVGCFMDIMSAILIIAPMLAPMAMAMGIDPIHMGIIFIVNLEIGYCTPPVGLNLFVASTLFRRTLGEVITAVLVPLAIMLFGLMLITWFPLLSTGLGRILDGKPLFDEPVVEQPKEDAPPADTGGVKTLEDMMREAREKAEGGEGAPKVKTLEELMRDAQQKGDDDEDAPKPSAEPARVKTLEELMRAAQEKQADEKAADDDADDAAVDDAAVDDAAPSGGAAP
jgi:C4-dicarboxylate transporter DctM subunit